MTETYSPCAFGLHICGISADGEEPIAIANFRTSGALSARRLWDAARERFQAKDGEPDDLVVDLCYAGDFYSTASRTPLIVI